MDREQAEELFSAYQEGELQPDKVEALERLLEGDDETREEYERFCRTLDSLALLRPVEPAPDDFVEKLQKKMRRRSGGKLFGVSKWGHVSRVPYELFSLVLILIILSVYLLTMPMLQIPTSSPNSGGGENAPGQSER